MELKGTYQGNQTPAERLRNKLNPFFTLVQMIADGDHSQSEFIVHQAKDCMALQQEVRDHIDDSEVLEARFYGFLSRREREREREEEEFGDGIDWDEEDFMRGRDLMEEEE